MEERKRSIVSPPIVGDCTKADEDEECKSNLHRWANSGTFRTCSLFANIPVRLVACGEGHLILVSNSFQVFSVGSNEYGQLGLGDRADRKTPREISFLSDKFVNRVSSGSRHSCAISKTGQVFCWGDSRYGQCGQGEKGIFTTPCRVRFVGRNTEAKIGLSNQRFVIVREVSCGDQHTLAIDSQGAMWSWGSGLATGLGQGDQDVLSPKKVIKMIKKRVTQIACGKYHSMALVQEDVNVSQDILRNEIICSGFSDDGNDAMSRVDSNVAQKIPFLENVFYIEEEDGSINWSMDLQKLSRSNTPHFFYDKDNTDASTASLQVQNDASELNVHGSEALIKDATIAEGNRESVTSQLDSLASNMTKDFLADNTEEVSKESHKPIEFDNRLVDFLEKEAIALPTERVQSSQSFSSAQHLAIEHPLSASNMSKSVDDLNGMGQKQKDFTNRDNETVKLLEYDKKEAPVELSDVKLIETSANDLYYSALDVTDKHDNDPTSIDVTSGSDSSSTTINPSYQSLENQAKNSCDPLDLSIDKSMEKIILSEHCSFAVDESQEEKKSSVSSNQNDNAKSRDRCASTWSIAATGSTYDVDKIGSAELYGVSQVWAWGENSHGQLGIGDSTLVIKER